MPDLILHHYETSPFAEKTRLMLGLKKLAWKSVIVPMIAPKPDVVALTGGYRKTPFLQIGADIYCDTALIADVLEHTQPEPTLYPPQHKGLARAVAQWADTTLFWASMAYNFHPKGVEQMFANGRPPEQWMPQAKAFAEDRSQMRQGAPRMPWADAAAVYRSYLRRIANMLEGQDYLLCAKPSIADLAVYHPLWFTRHRTSVMAGILDATPSVLAWMDRIAALGHGQSSSLSATEAIAISAASTRIALPKDTQLEDHGISLGSQVTLRSESFGTEATEGELVAATRMHYTLRRHDARAGTVHVHFPRIGYILKKVDA